MTFGELAGAVRIVQLIEIRDEENNTLCTMATDSPAVKYFADKTVASWFAETRPVAAGEIVVLLKDE